MVSLNPTVKLRSDDQGAVSWGTHGDGTASTASRGTRRTTTICAAADAPQGRSRERRTRTARGRPPSPCGRGTRHGHAARTATVRGLRHRDLAAQPCDRGEYPAELHLRD